MERPTITRAPALPYVDLAPVSDELMAEISNDLSMTWVEPPREAEIIRLTPRTGDAFFDGEGGQ